jgi:hypothetical protein
VEATAVEALGRGHADAGDGLGRGDDRGEGLRAGGADGLRDGQRGGDDDRRDVGDRRLVRVVEVQAVAEHAVGQRRGRRRDRAGAPDGARGPGARVLGDGEPGEGLAHAQGGQAAAQRVEDVLARDRADLDGDVAQPEGRRPRRELQRRGPLLGLDRHAGMMPRRPSV